MTDSELEKLLAVIRLGDSDQRGWWNSHSVDETAEYVLGGLLPTTWLATGVELAMESARLRHEGALERQTAVHVFSDYLPFHRALRSWLIERKLERDLGPLEWLRTVSTEDLRALLVGHAAGEQRAAGVYLGNIRREELRSSDACSDVFARLISAYETHDERFVAPYFDLVD